MPAVVEAYKVVGVVVPENSKRGNGIDLSVMPVNALIGRRVIEVAEGDLFPLRDSRLDSVYADVDLSFTALTDIFPAMRRRSERRKPSAV